MDMSYDYELKNKKQIINFILCLGSVYYLNNQIYFIEFKFANQFISDFIWFKKRGVDISIQNGWLVGYRRQYCIILYSNLEKRVEMMKCYRIVYKKVELE